MAIDKVINKTKDYKALYNEALATCNNIRNSELMADHVKVLKIKETVERYKPQIEAAAGRVVEEIDKTIEEIITARRKATEKGMEMAGQIELAAKSIRAGEYSRSMVSDMIEIYRDNPVMIENIRAAVKDSQDPAVKELYPSIPHDVSEEQIRGLEKVKEKIAAAPKLDTQALSGDWSVDMWKNGISIDGVIDFLLGLDGLTDNMVDDVMVEPEPLTAEESEKVKNILVNGQSGILFGNEAGLKLGKM